MSMNISLQTVAQQSRATLDTLNAAACAGTVKGRVGIRKDGELIVFKGMQCVLHLKQCQRAEKLMKAHELIAPRKPSVASFVSSLKLNGLRLDKRPATDLISMLNRSNEMDRKASEGPSVPLSLMKHAESSGSAASVSSTTPLIDTTASGKSRKSSEDSTVSKMSTHKSSQKRVTTRDIFSGLAAATTITEVRKESEALASAKGAGLIPTDPEASRALYLAITAKAAELWDTYFESDSSGTQPSVGNPLRYALAETTAASDIKPPISPKGNRLELKRSISLERMAHGDTTPVYTSEELKAAFPESPTLVKSMQRFTFDAPPSLPPKASHAPIDPPPQLPPRAQRQNLTRAELLERLATSPQDQIHRV